MLQADDEAIAGMGTTRRLSTTTLESDVYNYIEENNRTYHAFKSGSEAKLIALSTHFLRNQTDLQHELWLLTLGEERLYLAPVSEQLQAVGGGQVLDICTGTGIWATNFADRHPATKGPPNLNFEIDDLEEPWNFTDQFTFIHGRMMFACFSNPANIVDQAFQALQSGGYIEFQDALLWFRCDDRSLEGTAIAMWEEKLHKAARISSKDGFCSTKYKQYMEDVGFTDGLESFSIALLTRHLNMSEREVRELIERVKKEIQNERIHA
ncbi:S-adenosyl-L-methionine-dependent methyltransferase [Bisporella sp. PMI_857]|nr:S-adenosyl-L-methionine-dependent methyltransferase [Bisporella sp. PMI_857]